MKKLSIAVFFFTLCILISSASFGQSTRKFSVQGSDNGKSTITINGETYYGNISINGDSLFGEGSILPDSIQGELKGLTLPDFSNAPSKHYLSKDGERYYMDIVPPTKKGKKVDDSNIWLLGGDVAQAWH